MRNGCIAGDRAAVRSHDQRFTRDPEFTKTVPQASQITAHDRLNIGVGDCRAGTLVLAHCRHHVGRERDGYLW